MTSNIPYRHIVIEGGIGAGKSTLARAIAAHLDSAPLLEPFADNPFLEQFYLDPERYAFPVELSFLAQRYKQVKAALTARTLFRDALGETERDRERHRETETERDRETEKE